VLVDFLVEEGRNKVPAKQRKAALNQLVTALKAKTTVTKDDQLYTALGALTGMAMSMSGSGVISSAGADVESSYAQEWASWVDAAFKLNKAGYKTDAINFFKWGMENIPYTSQQARCVEGLARAKPNEAYDFLMKQTEKTDENILATSLRLLGHLYTQKNISKDKKTAIIDKLIENTKGLKANSTKQAAVYGLTVAKNPRAVEALKPLNKMTVDKYVRREALRSLLITFKDQSVLETLRKHAKGGMTSLADEYDQFFAACLLIQVGDEAGFTYAEKKLKKKGMMKKFMSTDKVDFRTSIVGQLIDFGGDKGRDVLKKVIGNFKDKVWIKTYMATALLELGDDSYKDLILSSLSNPDWNYTAVWIVATLAKHGDYSGMPVLKQLIEQKPKGGPMAFMKKGDKKTQARELANLRINIAEALAKIKHEDSVPLLITLLSDKDYYVRSQPILWRNTKVPLPSMALLKPLKLTMAR